ncbi:hypothetical protein D9M72_508250 [compost metagenome]
MPTGGCRPAHRLAVAAVQGERHAQGLAIVAAELKAVRAPALIGLLYSNLAIMSALRPRRNRSALQQQAVLTHDPIDPFHVDWRCTVALAFPTQYTPDPAIAIAGQMRDRIANLLDQPCIVGLPGAAPILPICRTSQLLCHIRARYTENFADPLHRSSPGNEGERAIHFRDFITSTASRRISFSMVFLPSRRCSSRTCLSASLNSDAGTTSSPALTADRLPSWYSLRQ